MEELKQLGSPPLSCGEDLQRLGLLLVVGKTCPHPPLIGGSGLQWLFDHKQDPGQLMLADEVEK